MSRRSVSEYPLEHMNEYGILSFLIVLLLIAGGCEASDETIQETGGLTAPFVQNERIVFFGDSITEQGDEPGGYVRLVADSLQQSYPDRDIEVIGAGISGNKVPDLMDRVDEDVLERDPSTVVVYIGINDVWHWERDQGTPRDEYENGLRTLVDTLQQTEARVLLCTPSVIGEQAAGTNQHDEMLDDYASITRQVARDKGAEVCDLRAAFKEYLGEHNAADQSEGVLTTDGVHLNDAGNRFVARQMIEALTRQPNPRSPNEALL